MPIETTKKKTRGQTKKRKEGLSINVRHDFLIRMVTVAIMNRIMRDKKRKVMPQIKKTDFLDSKPELCIHRQDKKIGPTRKIGVFSAQ